MSVKLSLSICLLVFLGSSSLCVWAQGKKKLPCWVTFNLFPRHDLAKIEFYMLRCIISEFKKQKHNMNGFTWVKNAQFTVAGQGLEKKEGRVTFPFILHSLQKGMMDWIQLNACSNKQVVGIDYIKANACSWHCFFQLGKITLYI